MVTALDQPSDRVRGWKPGRRFPHQAGHRRGAWSACASLARLKMVTDELRMRGAHDQGIGIQSRGTRCGSGNRRNAPHPDRRRPPASYERLVATLTTEHTLDVETDPNEALFQAAEGNYDLLIVSSACRILTACGWCSQARSPRAHPRRAILALAEADNKHGGAGLGNRRRTIT